MHADSEDGGFKVMPRKGRPSWVPPTTIQLTDQPERTAMPQERNPRRFAFLVRNDHRGRDFDILSGTKKSHLASSGVLDCLSPSP